MNVYLDASVLVALGANDPFTQRADDFLRREQPATTVSDFAKAEFASAIGRRVRPGALTAEDARGAFAALDVWTARAIRSIAASSADIAGGAWELYEPDIGSDLRRVLTWVLSSTLSAAECWTDRAA